jgi:phosphatidylserine/phosphatidylglycerophosphate/cardiolipin synthase-like enzyme
MKNLWAGRTRSLVALLGVTSVLSTTIWVSPAAAAVPASGICSEQGNYEVCVTYGAPNPANPVQDVLISRKIKAKIDATADNPQSGDYIRAAMYDWQTTGYGLEIAQALVRAKNNGVSVRLVVGTIHATIKSMFTTAGIDLRICPDSCIKESDGLFHGAMHNKFFVVKHGLTKLVLQSSMNLNTTQAQHAQNLMIVRDDSELFAGYVNYWRRLYDQSWTWEGVTWSDDDKNPYGTNGNSRAYFFPQYTKDPLVGVLAGVDACATGHDRIWLETSLIDESQHSWAIIDQLNRLRNIGCDIKVIVQDVPSKEILWRNGVLDGDITCDGQTHNKLLLIDAKYQGDWRQAVFVGSYNLTENSNYRANDAMLRIIDGWVTNRYIDQFRVLWNNTNPRACDVR